MQINVIKLILSLLVLGGSLAVAGNLKSITQGMMASAVKAQKEDTLSLGKWSRSLNGNSTSWAR